MYRLIKATRGRSDRCDKCRRPFTDFVFMGKVYHRWQKRCRLCAEKMVQEGKATFKGE